MIKFMRVRESGYRIIPAQKRRLGGDWRLYACPPIRLANQVGWEILAPCTITADWNGGLDVEDLRIETEAEFDDVGSAFGSGILTFYLPWVVRTEATSAILVRGPANYFRRGIQPIEALVETGWAVTTFTMNWRFDTPGTQIFRAGDPIGLLTPINLDELEVEQPFIEAISGDEETEYRAWSQARKKATDGGFIEGDYARGVTPLGTPAIHHRRDLALSPVEETTWQLT